MINEIKLSTYSFRDTEGLIGHWEEYKPKCRVSPKFNYFKKKLYVNKKVKNIFLLLMLRYDNEQDIFRLGIKGNLREWYFGCYTAQNLNLDQYKDCIDRLSKRIGVEKSMLLSAKVTKMRIGVTMPLEGRFDSLTRDFLWYRNFECNQNYGAVVHFKYRGCSFIFHDLYMEKPEARPWIPPHVDEIWKTRYHFVQFLINVDKVSERRLYKRKASTLLKILNNWNDIVKEIIFQAGSLEFNDGFLQEDVFKEMTLSEFAFYVSYRSREIIGYNERLRMIGNICSEGEQSDYVNEVFKVFVEYVREEAKLRDEFLVILINEIKKSINLKVIKNL